MTSLPDNFLNDDETLLWQGRVDIPSLIRRQVRRTAVGAGVALVMIIAMRVMGLGTGPLLVPILIVPVMLVSQGITRRARERDIYLLTDQRVGVWAAPSGPAARMEGMDEVLSGNLIIPLTDLDRVTLDANGLTLFPHKQTSHFPIQMTDLPEAPSVATLIEKALRGDNQTSKV